MAAIDTLRKTSTLTAHLKAEAIRLGLDAISIAPALPSEGEQAYRAWLEKGFAGEMGYMAGHQEKRCDPRLLLPGARSIIVALQNYNPPEEDFKPGLVGKIARYARGDDYHQVLKAKLGSLLASLKAKAGQPVQGKVYVDTGPVLEREAARRAGLANFGKNTNLLRKGLGSYFFVGEIIVDIELHYDAPQIRDMCGHCTRCLDACPTRAFPAPYVLDARKCISYLTIELKGDIPEEMRPQMGSWIFGCDICQEVCPYNHHAPISQEPSYQPRPECTSPSLLELLLLEPEEFARRFRNSPIKRAKRRGLLRNVAVALGNLKDPSAIPTLAQALQDPEPIVRRHAAWALKEIGGIKAKEILQKALKTERDESVCEAIRRALARI